MFKSGQECGDRLRNEIRNLLTGLNNGVVVANETVVPRCWISPDGNAVPAYTQFTQNWDARLDRYTGLFSREKLSEQIDDAIGRVIDEAAQNIILISKRNDLIIPYDNLKYGLKQFTASQIYK